MRKIISNKQKKTDCNKFAKEDLIKHTRFAEAQWLKSPNDETSAQYIKSTLTLLKNGLFERYMEEKKHQQMVAEVLGKFSVRNILTWKPVLFREHDTRLASVEITREEQAWLDLEWQAHLDRLNNYNKKTIAAYEDIITQIKEAGVWERFLEIKEVQIIEQETSMGSKQIDTKGFVTEPQKDPETKWVREIDQLNSPSEEVAFDMDTDPDKMKRLIRKGTVS